MAADYPDDYLTQRTFVNRPGRAFDANKAQRVFAEDLNKLRDETIAVEETLGLNANVEGFTVAEYLQWLYDYLSEISVLSRGEFTRDSVQAVTTGSDVAVAFNVETHKSYLTHSNSANPSRVTIQKTGWYFISYTVGFSANSLLRRIIYLKVNNTVDHFGLTGMGLSSGNWYATCALPLYLEANDFVEVRAYQNSGSTLDIVNSSPSLPSLRIFQIIDPTMAQL
jgi:hypothetical protein